MCKKANPGALDGWDRTRAGAVMVKATNLRLLWLGCGMAAAAGCYTGSAVDTMRAPNVSADPTDPGDSGAAPSRTPDKTTGLPCDLSKLLIDQCALCHGSMLIGAKHHLLSYEDLTEKQDDDPTKTIADLALARMQSTTKPMPPDGLLDSATILPLVSWINSGMPRGACGDEPPVAAPATPPSDAGTDAASVCTSGKYYDDSKDDQDQQMAPGTPCVSCHAGSGATDLFSAGTVYPTLHEPDNCQGTSSSGLSVVLIDANNTSHTIPVNAAGNFVRYTSIPLPYRALVVSGTGTKAMNTPQTDGDCNHCHSESGDSTTPGRIIGP
jgi:hypothetical protein